MNIQKYNNKPAKANEIPSVAHFIIKNNLTRLPKELRTDINLFRKLASDRYPRLFSINFDEALYDQVATLRDDDEIFNYLADYITEDILKLGQIPRQIRHNLTFLNTVMRKSAKNFYAVLMYIGDNKTLYDMIPKETLTIMLSRFRYAKDLIPTPFIATDTELFNFIVNNANIYSIPDVFDKSLYENLDNQEILKLIKIGSITIKQLPIKFLQDAPLLKKTITHYTFDLHSLTYLAEMVKTLNIDTLQDTLCELLCDQNINAQFLKQVYNEIDKEKIADYIISKNLIGDMDGYIIEDATLFQILLNREYPGILLIPFKYNFYQIASDKVFKLFKEHDFTIPDTETIIGLLCFEEYGPMDALCRHPDIVKPENIEKLAKYMAITKNDHISLKLMDNVGLFNRLLAMDIDFLFQVPFTESVFETVPIETLRAYYQKHPQTIPLSAPMRLSIRNIAQNVDYRVLKPAMLEKSRQAASQYMEVYYQNLGRRICYLIEREGVNPTYDFPDIRHMFNVLNITKDRALDILKKYKKNPTAYEETINELARKFYIIEKEKKTQEYLNRNMQYTKGQYTKIDKSGQVADAKKQKRKRVYYEYLVGHIKDGTLSGAEQEILSLISTLDKKYYTGDELSLITNIINGTLTITEPASYRKQGILKNYRRLKNNYELILNKIYLANPEYQKLIIGYLKGVVEHEEIRRVIEEKSLVTLHEIKTIYQASEATISLEGNVVSFNGNYILTPEEIATNQAYETALRTIKQIQRLINTEMNIAYPLEKITISEAEIASLSKDSDSVRYIMDYRKAPEDHVAQMMAVYMKKDQIEDEKAKRMYQKLLIDSGIVYAIPFLGHENIEDIMFFVDSCKYLPTLFTEADMTVENFNMIIKTINMYKYTTPADEVILGSKVCKKIAFNETYVGGHRTDEDKKQRVATAAKYSALAAKNVRSTIPYLTTMTDGIKAERYMSNDPSILTAGIDTDSCFRIDGNDNEFLLYTMFNKNGYVLKITDESGALIGRVSGFRNGNVLYLNQARSVLDTMGTPNAKQTALTKKLRAAIETHAKAIIDATKDTAEPIDYIFILKSYGYNTCKYLPVVNKALIPNRKNPMNVSTPDYDEFIWDPELNVKNAERGFTTDYENNQDVLLLASRGGKRVWALRDIKDYDPQILYDRPRQSPKVYKQDEINDAVIAQVNSINARDIYWGDIAKREAKKAAFTPITELDDIIAIVTGEDFYIMIDENGELTELCLQYDKRAKEEFNKYHNTIMEVYKTTKNKTR